VAHLVVELCSWAARRRRNDPDATGISDAAARQAVCGFIVNALVPTDGDNDALTDGRQRRGKA
jgi:hypothetical protein